jgi:hypothetical protein
MGALAQILRKAGQRWTKVGTLLEAEEGDRHLADVGHPHLGIIGLDRDGHVILIDGTHGQPPWLVCSR